MSSGHLDVVEAPTESGDENGDSESGESIIYEIPFSSLNYYLVKNAYDLKRITIVSG